MWIIFPKQWWRWWLNLLGPEHWLFLSLRKAPRTDSLFFKVARSVPSFWAWSKDHKSNNVATFRRQLRLWMTIRAVYGSHRSWQTRMGNKQAIIWYAPHLSLPFIFHNVEALAVIFIFVVLLQTKRLGHDHACVCNKTDKMLGRRNRIGLVVCAECEPENKAQKPQWKVFLEGGKLDS